MVEVIGKMKGIFLTITVFIIFLGLVSYLSILNASSEDASKLTSEKIAAARTFYYWNSVSKGIDNIVNVTFNQNGGVVDINDTLPAANDINTLLSDYGSFLDKYFEDPSIDIHFEDAAGNIVALQNMQSKIVLAPMNINYTWPDFGKNQVTIQSSTEQFSSISNMSIYVKLKNVQFNCAGTSGPNRCNKWSPDYSVASCSGVTYCLQLDMTYEDMNGAKFIFPETKFDISSRSTANLDVNNAQSGNFFIKIDVGALPPDVLNINLQNVQADTDTRFIFNTTQFYINYPMRLAVVTPFSKKVDWI